MKSIGKLSAALCACFAISSGYADLKVIPLKQISQEDLLQIRVSNKPEVSNGLVIAFSKGDRLPLSLFAKGDFFHLANSSPHELVINTDVYVQLVDEGPLFSKDLKHWKTFSEMWTGKLDATLTEEHGEPALKLALSCDLKK